MEDGTSYRRTHDVSISQVGGRIGRVPAVTAFTAGGTNLDLERWFPSSPFEAGCLCEIKLCIIHTFAVVATKLDHGFMGTTPTLGPLGELNTLEQDSLNLSPQEAMHLNDLVASFTISPELSTLSMSLPSSNETAISATSGLPSSSTSTSLGNGTFTTGNTVPTPTDSSASNITLASGENTLPAPSSSTPIANGTTTTGSSNISSTTTTTLRSTTTIWALPPFNLSCTYLSGSSCSPYNGSNSVWPTGTPTDGPLWTNTSLSALGYTSPPIETDASPIGEGTVITLTIEATPQPITPSPITPPPEEITLTATVRGKRNHTSSVTSSGQAIGSANSTGSVSDSTWPAESAPITMTIVIGSNMTSIVSTGQPLTPTTSSSPSPNNSSLISAISNSAAPTGSQSQAASETLPITAISSSTTWSAGATAWTSNSSALPVSSPTLNGTASSTGTPADNSTSTGIFNATTTSSTVSGGASGFPPASITSSPFWSNTTSSGGQPCSLTPSYLWRDWNWTTPLAPTGSDASSTTNAPEQTELGTTSNATTSETSPTPSIATSPTVDSGNSTLNSAGPPSGLMPIAAPSFSSSTDQETNGTATPTTGDWFAMSTQSDGSVLTTFVTHFGPVQSASESADNAAAAGVSPPSSSSALPLPLARHHVVVRPKRMATWAKMEEA
ncbi:hypothetical protein AYO20_05316 [Fonsecaea nubica]|uniref:Uncharacterized protein n=1 Tax=Fonsecaea nubica TaxID=856822 RepID=A0A178D161_9EURO|nr:hypothetical protein AYO20_05316 [Fonsecaea nubica]OAL35466.1 hypothetical protein AYO20_05316 [Fonsecaea nubica]